MGKTERDLTHMENLDAVSRDQWSKACAYAFIHSQTSEAIIAVASQGFAKYLRIAKEQYAGHGFHFEDFKRMYGYIKREGEKRARVRIHAKS